MKFKHKRLNIIISAEAIHQVSDLQKQNHGSVTVTNGHATVLLSADYLRRNYDPIDQ